MTLALAQKTCLFWSLNLKLAIQKCKAKRELFQRWWQSQDLAFSNFAEWFWPESRLWNLPTILSVFQPGFTAFPRMLGASQYIFNKLLFCLNPEESVSAVWNVRILGATDTHQKMSYLENEHTAQKESQPKELNRGIIWLGLKIKAKRENTDTEKRWRERKAFFWGWRIDRTRTLSTCERKEGAGREP